MKTFTIAEVAKATGVNKQTVRRRARELGIYDQMVPKDARGTMVMTAEQASMLSDAVMKAAPEQRFGEICAGKGAHLSHVIQRKGIHAYGQSVFKDTALRKQFFNKHCHCSKQSLCCTDVGSCFFTFDVLFTGL